MATALGSGARGVVLLPRRAPEPPNTPTWRVLRGDHPVPTPAGIAASEQVAKAAAELRPGQRLLYLLSGGTSSLFEVPCVGVSSTSLIEVYRLLLGSGAPIDEMNVVRRALSAVKGGGLLAATAADVLTLAVSDVAGDDPATIGSGPTVLVSADGSAARAVLERYDLWSRVAPDVREALDRPRPLAPGRGRSRGFHVVCSIADAVLGASAELARRGYARAPAPLTGLRGDVMVVAEAVNAAVAAGSRVPGRRALVLGGETTLRVPERAGPGGRNQHLAAALAVRLAGHAGVSVVCGGTDGIDGTGEHAGAAIDGDSAARARAAGHDLVDALARFTTSTALDAAGDALCTGSTGTNVGDLLVAAWTSG